AWRLPKVASRGLSANYQPRFRQLTVTVTAARRNARRSGLIHGRSPRRPEAGGGTTDLEDLTATRRRSWPSSWLRIVRLAVTESWAAIRAVACDRLDVPSLDPATAQLGLAPARKAGADQAWPVLIRKRSAPGVRCAWPGRE